MMSLKLKVAKFNSKNCKFYRKLQTKFEKPDIWAGLELFIFKLN